MKKILSSVLCIFIILNISIFPLCSASEDEIAEMIEDAAEYIIKTAANPHIGSIGGEWAVIGLARSGANVPDDYYTNYYKNALDYISSKEGALDERKYTEYSRVILAFSAIGKDPTDAAGFDLTKPIQDYDKTIWQGLNGPIWALIALDCKGYTAGDIREKYINAILEAQKADGGWSLSDSDEYSDADITSMALVSLCPYRNRDEVESAIERGIAALSSMQCDDGGFSNFGSKNSESAAQALCAISTLGISYTDKRFIKNDHSIIDYIKGFYIKGGGFAHTPDSGSNMMATEQCLYALCAAKRLTDGKSALFDMKDITIIQSDDTYAPPYKNENIFKSEIKYSGKTFSDIENHKSKVSIEALAERGIINGMTKDTFAPDNTMTRAEFATIVVNSLGLLPAGEAKFDDINKGDWFFDYINTALYWGIVNGISDTEFNPNGTITREQAAAMVSRAAHLCGIDTDMSLTYARDILAIYFDYIKISDWAYVPVAVCVYNKILDDNTDELKPQEYVTRAEIADMLYNLLRKAYLL